MEIRVINLVPRKAENILGVLDGKVKVGDREYRFFITSQIGTEPRDADSIAFVDGPELGRYRDIAKGKILEILEKLEEMGA